MWVPAKCNSVRESFSFSLNRPSNKRYCKTIWEYKYTTGQKEYRPEGISDRQRAHAIKPVSYTHLDVYKRQPKDKKESIPAGTKLYACPAYPYTDQSGKQEEIPLVRTERLG